MTPTHEEIEAHVELLRRMPESARAFTMQEALHRQGIKFKRVRDFLYVDTGETCRYTHIPSVARGVVDMPMAELLLLAEAFPEIDEILLGQLLGIPVEKLRALKSPKP